MENPDLSNIFGTSRSFKEWLHDPSNPLVYCLLTLDGKDFLAKNSYTVELIQKTADHDTFCITVPDDALDTFEGYVMENSKNLLGKDLVITYWRFGAPRQTFAGIIGGIRNKKDEGGGYGNLYITGYSPSILLENGKDCQSFENKTLEDIISKVTENYPEEAKVKVELPNTKYILPYTVQYKESDYQFIRRLAIRYGEFFYYNGQNFTFGTAVQPIIKLAENIDLIDIEFEMRMQSQDFSYISYDAQSGSGIEKDSLNIKSEFKENPFQSIAINTSRNVFRKKPKMHFNHTGISENSDKELEEAVKREKEIRENLMNVKGRSKDPDLKIGGRAEISDINSKAMETYRIIEIRHCYDGEDYYNEFVGIPDLFNAAPYINIEALPKGEEQPARVADNNDPMRMGRVKVQFPWQEEKNETTPWIRLIQPHSGSGKGFHFIPEIGEEVLVGFESGNAEKPFVMGTHYNGSETSSYHTAGNDKKVIHTRSGTKIILNDAEGSVFIEDPSGNTYLMDGAGNINVNAPNDMTFTAGKNLNINVGQNMTTSVGMNKSDSIGMNSTEVAGMNIMKNATLDYSLNATNITKIASETYSYEANDIHKTAMENIDVAAGKDYTQNSEETIHNLSGEKGHNA